MCHSCCRACVVAAVWLAFAAPIVNGAGADDDVLHLTGQVQADVYSIIPAEGPRSYRAHGIGSIGGLGTLDHNVAFGDRKFKVKISPRFEQGKYIATIAVEPAESDRITQPLTKDVDLSEFQSQSVELGRDADGRIYRLNVLPTVNTVRQPKQFQTKDLRMENWSVSGSIILNDEEYCGHWSGGAASLAWFEVLGVAKVEFSLLRLKDAQPWGTLSGGVVTIRHENGTTFTINGLTNGVSHEILPRGPYTVWVRWLPPTMTAEEYRAGMEQNIARIKEQIANGNTAYTPETLKQLERMIASDRPKMVMSGMRDVRSDEVEP